MNVVLNLEVFVLQELVRLKWCDWIFMEHPVFCKESIRNSKLIWSSFFSNFWINKNCIPYTYYAQGQEQNVKTPISNLKLMHWCHYTWYTKYSGITHMRCQ